MLEGVRLDRGFRYQKSENHLVFTSILKLFKQNLINSQNRSASGQQSRNFYEEMLINLHANWPFVFIMRLNLILLAVCLICSMVQHFLQQAMDHSLI